MKLNRNALVVAMLATTTGCASFVVVKGPDPVGHPNREASSVLCTDGKGWVWFDAVLAGLYAASAVSALVDPVGWEETTGLNATGSAVVYGALTGIGIMSSRSGSQKVDDCRAAKLEQLQRARERAQAWEAMSRSSAPAKPAAKR